MKKLDNFLRRWPITVLPLLWVLFSILNVLVNCIPDRLVKGSIASGIAQIKTEGAHPWIFFTPQSQLDSFTDSIMLQQSQRTSNWNAVTAYFTNREKWVSLESSAIHNPVYAAFANQGYPRYWHGYAIILKPLLVFFNYSAIRIISFIILAFLICIAFGVVKERFGIIAALCFTTTLSLINIFAVPMSLVFSPVTYITLSSICMIRIFDSQDYRVLAFMVVGAITNYVDFLTFPLLTLCIPLIFCVMHDALCDTTTLFRRFFTVIYSSLMWLIGYSSTWIMKWVISSLVIRENVISDAIHSIMVRSDTGGVNEAHGVTFNKAEIIQNNYNCIMSNVPKRMVFLFFFVIVSLLCLKFIKEGGNIRILGSNILSGLPVLLIGVAPIVWYAVLANHSAIHMEFYAYKDAAITIMSLLMFIVLMFASPNIKNQHQDIDFKNG
ncbi:hypothetical protein [Bifidobacterium cebidarum]|uniref:Glycosyltransferase RgtA/B/C/D-like domain-containing protein n=1 Tax=Bifidobacterium cebidarum TaxID=2650773 RepID=A0A6I1GD38_9BIFI|nr:hypothetical protein [Bifidobacterium cebidarum]KAB7786978.1 hypothetical protein F7D08_1574 [Bifidobacterium cebidarum]